ncbi:MAG: 4a-hydroxytetrahydrobiopterin dehydratase [Planctomycetota bacterium]
MNAQTTDQLTSKKCTACAGGVEKLTPEQALAQLRPLCGWRLTHDGLRIRKDWQLKNFLAGIDLLVKVAQLAEQEGHHPDLHLEGYRHVWIEIWTHAIGGLSENDFILAAKIDQLPVDLNK